MLTILRVPGVLFLLPAFLRFNFPWMLGLLALSISLVACSAGRPAADFSLTTFGGEEFRLSEQRGNAVVINFWYPSCPPCRDEMPAFQEVWEEYQGRNVRFIGLFVPQGFDTEIEARQFVDEFGLTFDFATDVRARVAQEYAVQYFPTTYFIDQAGRVHIMEISRMDVERLTDILDDLAG
jgi:peroxiredoxin